MSTEKQQTVGTVVALWRYPVKSMQGEELNAIRITERGLVGDRVYALIDGETGKIVSAKNPKKWPHLFDFRAAFVEPPEGCGPVLPARITFPDGTAVTSTAPELNSMLSQGLGREVALESLPPKEPRLEEYWPDLEELDQRDTVTDEPMPPGSFFDGAPVHLLTTAALDRLREAYSDGRFEVRRFRPNIVIRPDADTSGFVENEWVGRTLAIGEEVRLCIERPCPRCVMTTLPQSDLPADTGILRAAARTNQGHVGVYATVVHGGTIRRGDSVRIEG